VCTRCAQMKHKNAQLRYNVLNKCFRNKTKNFTISRLLEECNKALNEYGYDGIQKRQLYNDISYMKSDQGWSIDLEEVKIGRERVYRYSNTAFSIENASELNENQKEIVKEAFLSLKTMSGIPQLDHIDIDSVCAQLRIGLEDKENREEIYLKDINESDRDFYGGRFQEEIFLHIKNKTSIRVFWKNKKKENKEISLSPYLMKEFNSRWYLLGQSKFPSATIIPLDQITKIEEDTTPFIKKPRDIKNYFDDVVGVTVPHEKEKEEVVLKVKKEFWPTIESRPIHESRKKPIKEGDYYIERYSLIPNQELVNSIFQWGENIIVLKPESLRKEIEEKVKKMTKNYNSAH